MISTYIPNLTIQVWNYLHHNGGHIDLTSLCAVCGNHVKYAFNRSKKKTIVYTN